MTKSKKENPSLEPVLPNRKTWLFKAISIALPFFLLLLLEAGLRIFNYGDNYNLFIEDKNNPGFLVQNPAASKKYFSDQANATTGNQESFRKEKGQHTMRIFVLGESTTIGYPYFHNGSFHRWLQFRLMHMFPEKTFEIINLSLTAVNSYTVLGFARQVVSYQPDAVLIYTGHNEYYGAMGIASTENFGSSRSLNQVLLKLRELKVMQLLVNASGIFKGLFTDPKNNKGIARMQLMVANSEIPYHSVLYKKGIDQFRANMEEAMQVFSQQHIQVFFSNLVSNEKDMKPFMSLRPDSIKLPGFTTQFTKGVDAFSAKDFSAAYHYLTQANEVYNEHALCNYYLGRLLYMQGDYDQADIFFSRARDLDGLRFRAPAEINSIIAQLCSKYNGVHLVDTKAAFATWSSDHLIGDSLMLEHVHPNLTGYALISEAFYEAFKKAQLVTASPQKEMSFQQLLNEMPVTTVDSMSGAYRIYNLKKSWPFNQLLQHQDTVKIRTTEERLAWEIASKQLSWDAAMDSLYSYEMNRNNLAGARKVVETLLLEYPLNAEWYERSAALSGKLGDPENAIFYYRKSFDLLPNFTTARILFVLYLNADKPGEAMPYLQYAINNNTSQLKLAPVKIFAQEIIAWQQKLSTDSSSLFLLNQIATGYFKMGCREAASKYIQMALKKDNNNTEALSLLEQINRE